MEYSEEYGNFIYAFFEMVALMKQYKEEVLEEGFLHSNKIDTFKKQISGQKYYHDDAYVATEIVLKAISKSYENTLEKENPKLNEEINAVIKRFNSTDVMEQIKVINENTKFIIKAVKDLGFNYVG